jgi:hypothetical protein
MAASPWPGRTAWDIYAAHSTGTASFGAGTRVNTEAGGAQVDPAIGTDSEGRVTVTWADDRSGKWNIAYARSEGEGFGRGQVVGSGLVENLANELPAVAVGPDDRIHVAWSNAYITHPTYDALLYLPVYAVSADRGTTFSDPRQVSESYRYASIRQNEAGVAADSAAVHVVFTTYSPRDGSWVWHYRSDDGGQTFSAGIGVAQAPGGDVLHYPVVAVDQEGRIHVAWAHQRADEWDLYYARSTDGGVTFSTGQRISGER